MAKGQASRLKLRPVPLAAPNVIEEDRTFDGLPAWIEKSRRAATIVPAANWKQPGDYVEGVLIRRFENVGPNRSRQYHIRLSDGQVVAVWGSAALDVRMAQVPEGARVMIIYTGLQDTRRGLNPVKTYQVYYLDGEEA